MSNSKVEIPAAKLKVIKITKYIQESLENVAKAEGFENYEFSFDHGANIGDGIVGVLIKVKIQEINSDKSLHLLAKVPPESREMRILMKLFEREVFVYKYLLPEFKKFQQEMKVDSCEGFFNFPKVYFADYNSKRDDAIIIMEDLRLCGYKMYDKSNAVDFNHSKLIMIALGKLHAISFAMKTQNPEKFERFKALNDILAENLKNGGQKEYLEICLQKTIKALSNIESREKFQKLADDYLNVCCEVTNIDSIEPFGVVGHGDCWINNFIFHYKNDNPDGIVLIDCQNSRYSTPVADLLYFIFVCTDR